MALDSLPFKLLLCVFSSWVNRQQGQIIDYLKEDIHREGRMLEGMGRVETPMILT